MSLILWCGLALAADPPPSESAYAMLIAEARTAVLAKDWAAARVALDRAEAIAPANDVLVLARDLGRLDFYRGVVEWYAGDRDDAALDAWRRAAVIAPGFEPEADVLPEVEAQDAYYAVASEVKSYAEVDLDLPEDPGGITLFLDGQPRDVGDFARVGTHFVQLRCDDGSLVGSWYTLGTPPPDWLVLCSGGSYPASKKGGKKPTRTVAEAPKAVDPPKAAEAPKDTTPPALPTVAATEPPPADPPPADPADLGAVGDGGATVERERKGFGAAAWVTMGTGAALLAGGGAVQVFAFEPAWRDGQAALADPSSVTREEADALESRYDRFRYLAGGLFAGGGLTLGAGLVVGLVDARVVLSPSGVGLVGRW